MDDRERDVDQVFAAMELFSDEERRKFDFAFLDEKATTITAQVFHSTHT
ncbi:MAG: hypothetical protein ACXVAS_18875 [Vulcanimicrobiaceae bacterium]